MVVGIDVCIRNSYRKQGGAEGELPPHLEVHQDVHDHESAVEQARGKPENDPDYY